MRNRLVFLLFILSVIFVLAACGRGGGAPDDNYPNGTDTDAIQAIGTATAIPTQTLTVSAPTVHGPMLEDAAERLNDELHLQGRGIQLETMLYEWEHKADHVVTHQTLIAAGQGADIIFMSNYYPMRAFIEGGFLMDINELIDTYSNRDYFFENILEALEINGQLYAFPLNFAFSFVGINADLPQEFIDRFVRLNSVTLNQLAVLYNDLQYAHPELEHLAFGFSVPETVGVNERINQGVNWNRNTFSLSRGPFESLIENIRTAMAGNDRHGTMEQWSEIVDGNPVGEETLAILSQRYVFVFPQALLDTANALLDFERPYFVHHIPLAGGYDRGAGLLVDGRHWLNWYSVNTTADGELAMSYLYHLVAAWTGSFIGEHSLASPINRALFREHAESRLAQAINEPHIQPILQQGNSFEDTIAAAIARLEGYLEMPLNIPTTLLMMPPQMSRFIAFEIVSGGDPSQLTAHEMGAMVRNWLETEDDFEIDQAALDMQAILAARADLPYRTLTILSYEGYLNVFQQAAREMNLAWAERGEPYNFRIEVSSYSWSFEGLWSERDAARARFATMLMAGEGYDLFVEHTSPLWSWVESDLLTDIWELIDADPNVSRDDFYTNILDAFTFDGGLWAFPMSFGFEYVGINASLPQPFIDRFAQYETISIRELMQIYNDLMADYGDEFGHLLFGTGARTNKWTDMLTHDLGSFVDFDNRVSNMLDADFISFLEALRMAHPDVDIAQSGLSGLSAWASSLIVSREWVQELSHFVFFAKDHFLSPAFGLFPLGTSNYVHHIPITDDLGRLRIRTTYNGGESGIWATISFPSAGDSELAWEFTQHLMQAMVYPVGAAQFHPRYGAAAMAWGASSVSTPIVRSLFETQARTGLEQAINMDAIFGSQFNSSVRNEETRPQEIEQAMARLAHFNEMPAVVPPFIPDGLREGLFETLDQFMRGLITAEAAAQQMHNRMTLWLME